MPNIVSEYINFSRVCINRYLKTILKNLYDEEIASSLTNCYIETRYYKSPSNLALTITNTLNNYASKYYGSDKIKAENIIKTFNFIMYFDNVFETDSVLKVINALSAFRIEVLKIPVDNRFSPGMLEMVKNDLISKKEYLDSFLTPKFDFITTLTDKDNIYDIIINQNLKFPNIYSPTVINRVFKGKELESKRIPMEWTFASLTVLKNIISGTYHNYLVSFPNTLLEEKEKLESLMNIFDQELLLQRITIKLLFKDFKSNKELFYNYLKKGYNFALILDQDFEENEENESYLKLFKYLIVNRRHKFKVLEQYNNVIRMDK